VTSAIHSAIHYTRILSSAKVKVVAEPASNGGSSLQLYTFHKRHGTNAGGKQENKEYKARSGSERDLRCMQEQHKKLKANKGTHREILKETSRSRIRTGIVGEKSCLC
jgi:hypothetical protein